MKLILYLALTAATIPLTLLHVSLSMVALLHPRGMILKQSHNNVPKKQVPQAPVDPYAKWKTLDPGIENPISVHIKKVAD